MQDNKNLILAIVLCLVVLFGWGQFAQFMGWVQPPDPAEIARQQELAQQEANKLEQERQKKEKAEATRLPTFVPSAGREVTVSSPLVDAVLHTGGGTIRSFKLKKYHQNLGNDSPLINLVEENAASVAPLGLVINSQPSWSTGQWKFDETISSVNLEAGQEKSLQLEGNVDDLAVARTLLFNADTYLVREKIRVKNDSDRTRSVRIAYTVGLDSSNASGSQYDSMRIAWNREGSIEEESSVSTLENSGVQANGKIYWAGAMSTYFMAAIMPDENTGITVKGVMQKSVYRSSLEEMEFTLAPGQAKDLTVSYWIGPKDRKLLEKVSDQLVKSIDLGMFSMIAKGLIWLLTNFYAYVQNWGIAIILLTIVIKAVFWPLTAKSYASMEKMKKLQPMMTNIREKYKDDKEAMNREIMALYKTYGVNPASGCVPILIQLPVFFGLYQALLTAIELRHAPFITFLPGTDTLWLADLSAKDPFYITPIIMGATMFLQQKMSPPAADKMQQKIMMFLPIIFTALFLGFPSGLVIYWLVNNVLSIFQQWLMMRKVRKPKAAA